jgi:Kinetochore complex Fta4 of Sim4 subunit, or CENP-50
MALAVNGILKQHNRVVYSSQAVHHVARQIESLYLTLLLQDARSLRSYSCGIEKGTDLSNHMYAVVTPAFLGVVFDCKVISIGISKDCPRNGKTKMGMEKIRRSQFFELSTLPMYINRLLRYELLRARLSELDLQRQKQQQRLARYKQLASLLKPFKDPQRNVQPNIITRDSELGQELDRMRMLVARATGRISQSKLPQRNKSSAFSSTDQDEKIAALFDITE